DHGHSSAKRPVERPLDGAVELVSEFPIALQEAVASAGQAHPALGAAARGSFDELESRGALQLPQIAPRVAIGHLELFGGLTKRAKLADRFQQTGAAVSELEVVAERHPHAELRLHR